MSATPPESSPAPAAPPLAPEAKAAMPPAAPAPAPEAKAATSPAASAPTPEAKAATSPAAPAPAPEVKAAAPAPAHGAAPATSAAAEAKAAAIAKAKAAAAAKAAAPATPAPAPAPTAPAPAAAAPVPAPAPVAAAASNKLTFELSARTIAVAFSVLVVLVVAFGGLNVYLLIRLGKENVVARVVHQPPGLDGNKEQIEAPLAPGTTAKKPVAETAPAPPPDAPAVKIGENFKAFDGKPADIPGSWPTFRGGAYDNINTEAVKLIERWPSEGPKVLWSLHLGPGYAGAAIHQGRVYVLDYDKQTREDALRCFSLEDGKEIWRRSYKIEIKEYHGFSRTVPAVTDKYVVTIGPKCHVMCADAVSGDFKWGVDMVKDYGSKVPEWYTAQCPLIDGDVAILAPSGPDVLMMAVDLATGEVKWKTPNPKAWTMSHASVLPMTYGGRKMYLYPAIGGVAAVAADGPDAGTVLWESTELGSKKQVWSSALVLDDGHVFMTSGFNYGSYLFKVSEQGGKFQTKTLWVKESAEGLACEQQTPIYYNKLVYSVNPSNSGAFKEQLICMNPYDQGKVLWTSGKEKRFGQYEPFMVADGKLFVMSNEGVLTIAKPSREKYEPLSETKVVHGHEPWAPMALVAGRMILRDKERMFCLDMRAGSQ
jgi:outer membrane protein assembly factor BamB